MRGEVWWMLTKSALIGQIVAVGDGARKRGIAAKYDSPGYGHGSAFDGE